MRITPIEINVKNLSKSYDKEILDDLSFTVPSSSILAVLGPSGCGKSTLLRIIGGLCDQDSGEVSIGGLSPTKIRMAGKFGFAFQDPSLLPWRTVKKNVGLPLEIRNISDASSSSAVETAIDLVRLADDSQKYPAEISGGQKHRTALARALVMKPPILLLDEPFAGLDALSRQRLCVEFENLWLHSRPTTVMVTHSIDEALYLANSVLLLTECPAREQTLLPVPAPRPRGLPYMASNEFRDLHTRLTLAVFG